MVGSVLGSAGLALGASNIVAQSPLSAQLLIDRIKTQFGPSWRTTPTDAFHAGMADTVVRGISTTVMATFDVLKRSVVAGRNLIVSHEPTFYTGNDNVSDLTADAMYLRKLEFIKNNDLVVWRFHDNWHARRPEPMTQALAQFLGWDKGVLSDDPTVFVIPPTSLADVVAHIEQKLKVRSLRVIGARQTRITRVGFLPGTPPSATSASRLLPKVDLIIAGEQREWEGVYYAHDVVSAGESKAMITVGHAISEDPGMKLCADWLKTFISEVPVEWLPAGEPFTKI